jgi:hypothetical protein
MFGACVRGRFRKKKYRAGGFCGHYGIPPTRIGA